MAGRHSSSMPTTPLWPTTLRSRSKDGRIRGTDGSVWLYRAVPMAPVADARSPVEGLAVGEPLRLVLDDISAATAVRVPRRGMAKSGYRDLHILLVNIPVRFTPPRGSQLAGYLSAMFPDVAVDRRMLVVGVKLRDQIGGGDHGLSKAIDSVVQTLSTGVVPMSDFDADFAMVDGIMARAGLTTMTPDDYRIANAWWNHGYSPDAPLLVHTDHIHVFGSSDSARLAATLVDRDGDASCGEWTFADHHTVSFGCVQDFDLPYVDETSVDAQWVSSLVEAGAVCVSIRGKLEPPQVTRAELRRRKKQAIDDEAERASQNKMSRSELEERLAELDEMEAVYAIGGPPVLVEASTVVAFTGFDERSGYDMRELALGRGVLLSTMTARQNTAMAETWLASNVRAVPYLHDIPSHTLAASGLPNLSTVGDRDGALVGFTERDHQPSYMTATASADNDALPIFVCAGSVGSGKTAIMQFLADQFSHQTNKHGQRRPVLIVDPKAGSDLSPVVLGAGGRVASLDELTSSDGVFDPLRFAARKEVGVELAASMLMSINPWGTGKLDYETPLIKALSYGADKGADCTGVALKTALDDGQAPKEMVERVFDLAGASPMFRACVGVQAGGPRLRSSEGITLIKVGQAYLDLPEPGATDSATQQQRIALALVRMMVYGSAMALTGRQGVLMLDEAWVMLSAGRSEVERLGRLARSQEVLPMLFTQRVTDATNAGLSGYIARGIVLPIEDRTEADAACELFRLEPTPERIARITAKASLGGIGGAGAGAPNWSSMRALRDPTTGRVLRGAVGIYVDLSGRAVPVEVKIPSDFLAKASTNPEDIRRRLAAAGESPG